MNKLTDYVTDVSFMVIPQKEWDNLNEEFYEILKSDYERLSSIDVKNPPDDIRLVSDETVVLLASAIDKCLPTKSIVYRTMVLFTSVTAAAKASENMLKKRITSDIISELDIEKIIKEARENERRVKNN